MSWYDFIPEKARFLIPPEVKSITKLAEGDYGGAFDAQFGIGGQALHEGYDWAENKYKQSQDNQRAGYDAANRQLNQLGDSSKAFQMQGLDRALGFYGPARDRINALYGPPGSFKR